MTFRADKYPELDDNDARILWPGYEHRWAKDHRRLKDREITHRKMQYRPERHYLRVPGPEPLEMTRLREIIESLEARIHSLEFGLEVIAITAEPHADKLARVLLKKKEPGMT